MIKTAPSSTKSRLLSEYFMMLFSICYAFDACLSADRFDVRWLMLDRFADRFQIAALTE